MVVVCCRQMLVGYESDPNMEPDADTDISGNAFALARRAEAIFEATTCAASNDVVRRDVQEAYRLARQVLLVCSYVHAQLYNLRCIHIPYSYVPKMPSTVLSARSTRPQWRSTRICEHSGGARPKDGAVLPR
jgi:hypothetical protein